MQKLLLFPVVTLMCFSLAACIPKPAKKVFVTKPGALASAATNTVHEAEMRFLAYNDDGDYFLLFAKKGDSTYSFVNSDDKDRSLNRGDLINVRWEDGTVTMAGDGEAPAAAALLRSLKKTADGPVTKFTETYGQEITYSWPPEENFSKDYLDRLYRLVEYYLAGTENELLKAAIMQRSALSYSVETKERDGRMYRMIGIGTAGTQGTVIAQWLYLDAETESIFVYDLPADKLAEFK